MFLKKTSAGLCVALFVVGAAAAGLNTRARFDIAPQDLPDALLKYSQQSGIQVTSRGEILEGKVSGGVAGTLEARAALDRLLQGTNLTYHLIDARTVTIRPARKRAG